MWFLRALYSALHALGVLARRGAWRYLSHPLPAVDGWEKRLRDVEASDGAYVDPETAHLPAPLLGAPLAWSLLRIEGDKIVPVSATCWATGRTIGPVAEVDPETNSFDGTYIGVRCARCGIPIQVLAAGMRHAFSVPSCPPCRPAVRRVLQEV